MQIPQRRAQIQRRALEEAPSYHITSAGLQKLQHTLEHLEKHELPRALEDMSYALSLGDFSENAEYHSAKARLANLHSRIFSLKERIKRAILIDNTADINGEIRLGSTVTLNVKEHNKTYQIVGPQEANPTQGRISHVSPLGAALLGHVVGDQVTIQTETTNTVYTVLEVK